MLCNKRGLAPQAVLTLDGVPDLEELSADDGMLIIGGRVLLNDFKAFIRDQVPEMARVLEWFGSPQIRNAGTLAGNIANASPIADTIPFLLVMEARLELSGPAGPRMVDMNSFYRGYKQIDLRPDEIITRIFVPVPAPAEELRLYRVSKRQHLDIATFTAALLIRRGQGIIESIRIAYGGVAPTVLRLPRTESFLQGKAFTLDTFEAAGQIARDEIRPISDVRGSAAFRSQLAENILKKFYFEMAPDSAVSRAS